MEKHINFYDYIVYDNAEVVSKGRWIEQKHRKIFWKEKKLEPTVNNSGYYILSIRKNGEQYSRGLHQIVWEAFNGEIPEGYEVDHIDNDPSNNNLSNLQLLTHEENLKKKHRTNLMKEKMINRKDQSMAVNQYTLDKKLVKTYPSSHEAARQTGYVRSCISKACNGQLKTYKGYYWEWEMKQ